MFKYTIYNEHQEAIGKMELSLRYYADTTYLPSGLYAIEYTLVDELVDHAGAALNIELDEYDARVLVDTMRVCQRRQNKVLAIKVVRLALKIGLNEAKELVDGIWQDL